MKRKEIGKIKDTKSALDLNIFYSWQNMIKDRAERKQSLFIPVKKVHELVIYSEEDEKWSPDYMLFLVKYTCTMCRLKGGVNI